jgi:pimeloyl-ACP methyl ester carboxylesterase
MPFADDIHYRRSDKQSQGRTPLVLVHGAGGSYLYWPTETRRIEGEDVMAIDLPGHGGSPGEAKESIGEYCDDVLSLLDLLKIEQAIIGGHSMGGAIALQLGLDSSERVRGLILIGSGAKYEVNPKLIQYCEDERTYPQALQFVVKFSFSQAADERLVELAAQRMAETPASILRTDFMACNEFDIRDRLSEIRQPTLVICGEKDKMMPVSCSQLLSDRIPGSRLEIVTNAGHMVMLEQPEFVAQLIQEFLNEIKLSESNI